MPAVSHSLGMPREAVWMDKAYNLGHQAVVGEPCTPVLRDVPGLYEGELYSPCHVALTGSSWRREVARDPTT